MIRVRTLFNVEMKKEKTMKANISEILSKQVNKELYSAYLYLEFQNIFNDRGLQGFSHWYMIQTQEERDHAMLFYQYLQHNNQKVVLEAVEKPVTSASSILEILEAALAHEEYITASINDIYELALREKDYRTKEFLDWFVKEQGEEEANAQALIDKVKFLGEDPKNIYLLDQELAARVYTAPSLTVG